VTEIVTPNLNGLAKSVVKAEAFRKFDDGSITASAFFSGFFWLNNSRLFIVTNWHNVTGLNSIDGSRLGSFTPSHVSVLFYGHKTNGPAAVHPKIERHRVVVPLYNEEHEPQWIGHSSSPTVDVVAIPFPPFETSAWHIVAMNRMVDFETSWKPRVMDECFIIGFPEGIQAPIFKRGTLASDMQSGATANNPYLIDTLGNRGLSGAPVIGKGTGILNPGGDRNVTLQSKIGTWLNFCGVYAGRMSDHGVGSQLGRVFPPEVVRELPFPN